MLFLYIHPILAKLPTPSGRFLKFLKQVHQTLKWWLSLLLLIKKILNIISGGQAKAFARLELDEGYYASVDSKVSSIKSDWDTIPRTSDRLSTSHLILYEMAGAKDIKTKYVRVYKGERIVAIMMVQLLRSTAFHVGKGNSFRRRILQQVGRWYTSIFPIMVCGHVFRSDMRCFSWDSNQISYHEAEKIFMDVVSELESLILPSIIELKDINLPFFDGDPSILAGYERVPSDFGMRMYLPPSWKGISDYMADLTREYKSNFVRKRKKFGSVTIRELSLEEATLRKAEIWSLYKEIVKNQPFSFGLMPADYMLNLKAGYRDRFKLIGFFDEDTLIAFTSAFIEEQTYSVYYIGMNYLYKEKFDLYFNLLFYCLEDAISMRKKYLFLGRTAPDPKARLGCHPIPMNSAFRVQNLILKILINRILYNTPKNDWRKYNPFKGGRPIG